MSQFVVGAPARSRAQCILRVISALGSGFDASLAAPRQRLALRVSSLLHVSWFHLKESSYLHYGSGASQFQAER